MRVYTNVPYIKRRGRLGDIVSWAGLIVLALGLFITLRSTPGSFTRFAKDAPDLAKRVANDRNTLGFLTLAELQQTSETVTLLPVDGVTPTGDTIADGSYPLGDALVIISPQNSWIGAQGVSKAQLAQLLSTETARWKQVQAEWPNSVISRIMLPQEGNSAFAALRQEVMAPIYGDRAETVMLATLNTNYSKMVLASFVALGLGFIAAQIGGYNKRRFSNSPRPDERLVQALKGFDDRYTLYNWMLPASYVLLGPNGLYTLALREHSGTAVNTGNKWKHQGKRSALNFLLAFSAEGLGNPSADALADAQKLYNYINKNLPDTEVDVQPLAFFTNPEITLELNNPAIPVVKPDQLKALLRQRGKDSKLDSTAMQKLQTLFEKPAR
ncbi:MAG: hypothetical protein ABTQ73_07740 [Caldilineales bacterium]